VDLSGTYASKRYRISDNSDVVNGVQGSYDSYVTENVKVTYSFGANKIFAGVDNISDQQYYTIYKTPGRTYNVGTSFSYN
jgi:outer membrane receptor for ferrienterochelin and colicin